MIEIKQTKKPILDTLTNAKKSIKIVTFQFSDFDIMKRLLRKRKKGTEVAIITLPTDSINNEKRAKKAKKYYKKLREAGVDLFENNWEVGDPTLTDTSESGDISEGGGEKWYSLHGKFIVTDKEVLIMSANLDERVETDIFLRYNEPDIIDKFNQKFEWLKEQFIEPKDGIPGRIMAQFSQSRQKKITHSFERSKRLRVKGYPEKLSPKRSERGRTPVITPFDIRARSILYQLIEDSNEFIYLLSERLYDGGLVEKLEKKALNSDVDIKIITGRPEKVRQNTQKARKFFRVLSSAGVDIKAMENIHAKCWLSEKILVVGSANLTKMNLGFQKGKDWRSNTETLMLENQRKILIDAKEEIEAKLGDAETVVSVLGASNKAKTTAKKYFDLFEHYSREDAKITFGKLKLKFETENEKKLFQIARYSAKLAKKEEERYIKKEHVTMSAILTLLQGRASTSREVKRALSDVIEKGEIEKAMDSLLKKKLINLSNNEYKLNLEELI